MKNSDVVREFREQFGEVNINEVGDMEAFLIEKLNEREEQLKKELKTKLLAEPVVDSDGNKTWNACVNQLLKLL